AGAASALGFLVTPISFDFVHSLPGPLESLDWDAVDALYRAMEGRGRAMLTDAGVDPAEVLSVRRAEMRLAGQFHDIAVPVPDGRLGAQAAPGLAERFESEYRRLYGIYMPGRQIQVLNWRVLVTGPSPGVRLAAASVDRGACAVHALRGRLINSAEECWITVWRTAFSLITGEAQDFGCELFDPDAHSIAHSPRSMPVFNLTLLLAVRRLLTVFPRDTLRPGDAFVTNDQ